MWRIGCAVGMAFLAGCAVPAPKISPERLNVIALCNAGYSVSIGVNFEADVQALAMGGPVKGGIGLKQSLKGQFLNGAKVSEENAVLLYQSYVSCVQSERSLAELVAILQQRRQVLIDKMTKDEQTDALAQFELLFLLYIQQTQNNQKVAAHETGRQIQQLLTSAAQVVQKETGLLPNYFFENRNRQSPKDLAKLYPEEDLSQQQLPSCMHAKFKTVRDGEFVYSRREPCQDPHLDPCAGMFGAEFANCRINPGF